MHLAEFILTNIEPLSREWEEFAKSCTPAAIGMTRSTYSTTLLKSSRPSPMIWNSRKTLPSRKQREGVNL